MFACLDAKGENYIVEVDLPGVNKKDIDLNMHEDIIHVLAEREDLAFHGHLHFPIKVDPKKAKAKFSNGLLQVEVPVKEKRGPPIKIEVE
jgi:HSP20 family protein